MFLSIGVLVDYEFKFDGQGRPLAKFSMEHEAIGCWLTDESNTLERIDRLLLIVDKLEKREIYQKLIVGGDYELQLFSTEVEFSLLNEDSNDDFYLEEELSLYEGRCFAGCGLLDFKQALESWRAFIDKNVCFS